nr:YhjD/YihY/BrkB family envelope integrity protein [Antarcticibacterium flavum]
MRMVLDRVISFGMVLAIGFLMLMALVISALVAILGDYIGDTAPVITTVGLKILNYVLSFVFITVLFGAIFKLLPDIHLKWRITIYGAALTTILFLIGEFCGGDPGSPRSITYSRRPGLFWNNIKSGHYLYRKIQYSRCFGVPVFFSYSVKEGDSLFCFGLFIPVPMLDLIFLRSYIFLLPG